LHLSSSALPDGFEFSKFSLEDVMAISSMPERADYVYKNYVVDNYKKGDICLGLKFEARSRHSPGSASTNAILHSILADGSQ
jgi:hypothetical protein